MELPHIPDQFEKDSNSLYRAKYLSSIEEFRQVTRSTAQASYKASPEFATVSEYIRYLENDTVDKRRPKYKSKYRNNKMGLARQDRIAKLTQADPIADVSCTNEAYEQSAYVVDAVIKDEYRRRSLDQQIEFGVDLAGLHGTAFFKIGAAKNRLNLMALGPDQVIPIQPGPYGDVQGAVAVWRRNYRPIHWFQQTYPISAIELQKRAKANTGKGMDEFSRPANIGQTTWDRMNPGIKHLVGIPGDSATSVSSTMADQVYGLAEYEEIWVDDLSVNASSRVIRMKDPYRPLDGHNWWYDVEPGERLYPRKRVLIFGAGILLYDGPGMFWHGLYPFESLQLNPCPWSWYGLSIYRDLLPLQQGLNEIPAGVMDQVRRAINPQIIASQRDVSPPMFHAFAADMPGARFLLNPGADPDKAFRYQDPPQLPAYVQQMLVYMGQEFDRAAGNVDINALSGKNQVPGGDTVEQMKDNLQSSMQREEKQLERTFNCIGAQAVSNVIQFFDVNQRVRILGASGVTDQDFFADTRYLNPPPESGIPKEYFPKMFSFKIQPGSLNPRAKDAAKMEAVGLSSRQLASKPEAWRMMGWDQKRIDRNIQEMIQETEIISSLQNGGAGGTRTPRSPDAKNDGVGV